MMAHRWRAVAVVTLVCDVVGVAGFGLTGRSTRAATSRSRRRSDGSYGDFDVIDFDQEKIAQVLAGAESYAGPDIMDIEELHPNNYPVLWEPTHEQFDVEWDPMGFGKWDLPTAALVSIALDAPGTDLLRQSKHLDHIYWAREASILSKASPDRPKVWLSDQLLSDDGSRIIGSIVAVIGGSSDEERAEFLAKDPVRRAGVFAGDVESTFYKWTIVKDPYLQIECWPAGNSPFILARFDREGDDAPATRAATRERHLSFLRKTRRTARAGPLRLLHGGGEEDRVVGSLVYAFHDSRASCKAWADEDPYAVAGLFGDDARHLTQPFCEIDVTGEQNTVLPPLNLMPDPILARLVKNGLVTLPMRKIQRVQQDVHTGEMIQVDIETDDPRMLQNLFIDPRVEALPISPKGLRASRAKDRAKAASQIDALTDTSNDDLSSGDYSPMSDSGDGDIELD